MVQKDIVISMIAPVAIGGILILAVLTAIPSNALMTHSSSEYQKCVKSSNNCFLLNNESSNAGNGATSQESSNAGNGATSQESSNTGNAQESSNTGTCNKIFCENQPQKQESSNNANGVLSQENSNTGNGPRNSFTFNSPSQESSNTGNAAQEASNEGNTADLSKTILEIHNSERATVGIQPLVWNDKLAADAKVWAEHLATTGEFKHDPNKGNVGENIAGFNPSKGVSAPGEGQQLWVAEKKDYHSQPVPPNGSPEWDTYPGHYTQMVWRDTKEVGCGTASGSGHPYSILVCRYSPPGNYNGQKPY